jgi:hypothetical protein
MIVLLRSRVSGRDRWLVPALCGNERLAAGVEMILRGEEGILEASANPATGRILIHYLPESLNAPIDVLLQRALAFGPASEAEYVPHSSRIPGSMLGAFVWAELGCLVLKLALFSCPVLGTASAVVLFMLSARRAGSSIPRIEVNEPDGVRYYQQRAQIV